MNRNVRLEKQAAFVSIGLSCLIFLMPVFLLIFGLAKLSPGIARTSFFGTALSVFTNSPAKNALLSLICFSILLLLLAVLFLLLGLNQLKRTKNPPSLPLVLSARLLQGAASLFLVFVFFAHLSSVFVLIWAGLTFALLVWQTVCWEENRRFVVSFLGYDLAQKELGVVGSNPPALPAPQNTAWNPETALEFSGEKKDFAFDFPEEIKTDEERTPSRKKLSFENYQKTKNLKLQPNETKESPMSKKRKINIQAALLEKKEKSKVKKVNNSVYDNVPGVTFEDDPPLPDKKTISIPEVSASKKPLDSDKFVDAQLDHIMHEKNTETQSFDVLEKETKEEITESNLGLQILKLLGGERKDISLVKEKLKEMLDKDLIDTETYVSAMESLKKINV